MTPLPAPEPTPDPGSFVLSLDDRESSGASIPYTPEALQKLLASTRVTLVADFLARGRTLDDYRGAIGVYLDRFAREGDLSNLAKAILKSVALREHIQRGGGGIS